SHPPQNQRPRSAKRPGLSSPSGDSQSRPVVTVEVLVEEDQVTPVRVGLELRRTSVYRTRALLVPDEDAREPPRDLLGHLEEVHLDARARRAFDGKARAVERVQVHQR